MYKTFIRPILQNLDHEDSLNFTKGFLHRIESNPVSLKLLELLIHKGNRFRNKKLEVSVAGLTFDNPLILGAGWDKTGIAVRAMHTLGFSGVEVGSVLAYPQPGNFKSRLNIIGDGVALNSFGFNSPGMEVVAQNLDRYTKSTIPIGINISKNKYIPLVAAPEMYAVVLRRLYDHGSYFVINVSSPNTIGLNTLQNKKFLKLIVDALKNMMHQIGGEKPLFIKVTPDISHADLDDVIEVVMQEKLAGIIAVNTFPHANLIAKYGQTWEDRSGGLSGNDRQYRMLATRQVAYMYTQTKGKMTIIGVGGINSAESALEKIRAGASLIQLLTGLYAEGPYLPGKINRGLVAYMEKEKVKSIKNLVGVTAKNYSS